LSRTRIAISQLPLPSSELIDEFSAVAAALKKGHPSMDRLADIAMETASDAESALITCVSSQLIP
jgi:hypothetical protein